MADGDHDWCTWRNFIALLNFLIAAVSFGLSIANRVEHICNSSHQLSAPAMESLLEFVARSEGFGSDLNNLKASVEALTDRLDSPLSLYQGCVQETKSRSCTASTTCTTPSLNVNVTDYYTVDIRCQFDTSKNGASTAIRGSNGDPSKVSCVCSLPLSGDPVCTITAVRCPMTVTVK